MAESKTAISLSCRPSFSGTGSKDGPDSTALDHREEAGGHGIGGVEVRRRHRSGGHDGDGGKATGHDGDVALALFDDGGGGEGLAPDDDPAAVAAAERRLVRKIDFMILPYLAVCYAFFYIDKTTLSYAALFGLRDDLGLRGTDYSWLSSVFYFGFLAWAIPTNLLMQRFPIGKYLGANVFMWWVTPLCFSRFLSFSLLPLVSVPPDVFCL